MGQEGPLGRQARDGFGSSEPACIAQCRAPASVAGSLVGSTDDDSSIDIVGLKPLKTAALRAEQEDGALQWKSSSPRNTERRRSGTRSRFAPDFLGLHEGEETPEEPQPASAGRETTEGLQHDMNGNSSAAVGNQGTQMQQPGQGAGSSADVFHPMQQQQQQQQLEDGVQSGGAMMSDDEGGQMHEEGGAADSSAGKDWSSLVCCTCDDGGELLNCDGPCQRSFHFGFAEKKFRKGTKEEATEEDEEDDVEKRNVYDEAWCNPLSMNQELANCLTGRELTWQCPNCLAGQHQCFICKQEGSSEAKEVVACIKGSCGRFYHIECLEQRFPWCKKQAEAEGLWAFGNFVCPSHNCKKCKQEDGAPGKGALIPCARCPLAYHLDCMPEPVLSSQEKRVWLNKPEAEHWGEGHRLLQQPGVEPTGGVEDCILYCQRHRIPEDESNPVHVRPLIKGQLLALWKLAMANEYKHLEWSEQYLRTREKRLKMLHEQREAEKEIAQEEQAASQAPSVGREQLRGAVKRRRLVKKPAEAAGTAPAKAAVSAGGVELEDLHLAQRVRRPPAASKAAPAKRKAAAPKADGPGHSKAAGSPGFGGLDSSPVIQQRKKRPFRASEDAPAASLLGSLHQASAAQGQPAPARELPTPAWEPLAQVALRSPEPPRALPEPATTFDDEKAADFLGLESLPEAEDVTTLMRAYFYDEEGAEGLTVAEEELSLSPPSQAVIAALTQLLAFEQDEHWGKDKESARTAAIMKAGPERVPNDKVEVLMPKPFDNPSQQTIPQASLEQMATTAKMQLVREAKGFSGASLITPINAKKWALYQDKMLLYLAPLLHKDRYTSYGRHFTEAGHLEALNEFLLPYLQDQDTVVDFSCGANVWVPMLKSACLQQGIATVGPLLNRGGHDPGVYSRYNMREVKGISYDIITPRCMEDFRHETWFNVDAGSLPPNVKLVIGLNPPFGKNGTLAALFADLAARHKPRIIVLIVPPQTAIPLGYTSIKEDQSLMSGECFFVPGSTSHSWNQVTPSTRILVRNDCLEKVVKMQTADTECVQWYDFPQREVPPMGMAMMPMHHMGPAQPHMGGPMFPVVPGPMPVPHW